MTQNNILTKQPDNTNLISTNKYSLVFPTLPHINFFIYSLILPGVSTNAAIVGTPFVDTKRHGDKLVFEPLNITCLVDEDLKSWRECFDWLTGLTYPKNFNQYIGHYGLDSTQFPNKRLYSDAELTIRTNANNPNIKVSFKDCHPVSLSSIQFSNADNPELTAYFDVTFEYDYYNISTF